MAWASADIPTAELARRAKDYPLLVGHNAVRLLTSATLQWKQGGSWAAGADETDANGPVRCAGDDWQHAQTYPGSSQTTWYLIGNSAAFTGDTLAILNPSNLNGVQIDLQIADANTYAGATTIATTTPADNARVVILDLDHTATVPQRYTGITYWRIKFAKGAGFIPRLGEVVFGRSRQMPNQPLEPGDRRHLRTRAAVTDTDGGVMAQQIKHSRRRFLNHTFRFSNDTDESIYEGFWETDMSGGVGCFLYIDQPTAYPTRAWWMMFPDPEMSKPRSGFSERTATIVAQEQGDKFLALGV